MNPLQNANPDARADHAVIDGGGFAQRFIPLLVALVLAGGLSWHFFAQPLRPWPDQGWVLQAAVRHARGQGLSTQMRTGVTDLTEVRYDRLVYFPPLYPLVVSCLLQMGIPVELAVKLINALALVVGVCAWMVLSFRYLSGLWLRLVFAGLLVTAGTTWGSAMVPKGGTADYLLWSALPCWLMLMLSARHADRMRTHLATLIAASAFVALLIGVRWAAVVLIPSGGLILLWPDDQRKFTARMISAIVYGLPAVAAYWIYGAINRAASEFGGNSLAFITPRWEFFRLNTLFPFESVFTIPMGVEALLRRLWRATDPSMTSLFLGGVFRLGLPVILILGLIWLRARYREPRPDCRGELRVVLLLFFVTQILFLAFLSVRYSWGPGIDWSYLDEPRYYRPLYPAALLFWLTFLPAVGQAPRVRSALVGLLTLGLVYQIQAHVRSELRLLTVEDESWTVVEQVRALHNRDGLNVVCDGDVSDYIILADPNLLAFNYPLPEEVASLRVGRPADLWLVRRVNEKAAYILDPEYHAKRFSALARRFRAEKVWTSSGGEYELYHARILP